MCKPMCATAQRMAELEAENARLREALTKIAGSEPWSGRAPLAHIAKTALTSPTQKEARDAG